MKRGALLTGVDHAPGPAPAPEAGIHLPIITEDLLLRTTSHLHAMLCHAIVHPPGGILHNIALLRVTIGRKGGHLEELGKYFVILLFILFYFLPQASS